MGNRIVISCESVSEFPCDTLCSLNPFFRHPVSGNDTIETLQQHLQLPKITTIDIMAVLTTVKCSKCVSWACPLVGSLIQYSPVQCNPPTVDECETRAMPQTRRTAIQSLRDILKKYPSSSRHLRPGSRHDSLDVSNEAVTSALTEQDQDYHGRQEQNHARYQVREEAERTRYDICRQEREQALVSRIACYGDHSQGFRWTAACKLVDTLASRDTEPRPDYFFSDSDLLVALFINCDLNLYSKGILAEDLLKNLTHDFPHVKNFRFAVFLPRQLVQERSAVPKALRYLLGTLSHLQRTISLEGATTEMEEKFVTRQLHYMRRARSDPVKIHESSLDEGRLVAKVDPEDTYDIVIGSQMSQETTQWTSAQPIDIVCRKRTDVDAAWRKPTTAFHWA